MKLLQEQLTITMNKIYLFFLMFLIFLNSIYPNETNEKKILVLHSYHKGLSWTEDVINGIESVFNNRLLSTHKIKIFYEYMDTKRFEDPRYLDLLIPIYKYKSNQIHYDVIIAVDDNAVDFLIHNRNKIFGEIPVIFCGVNFYDEKRIHQISKITGVVEAISIEDNIELIKKIHPEVKRIIVVGDNTTTSKLNNKAIQKYEKKYSHIQFQYLTDSNIHSYRRYLSNLSRDSVVLAMLFNLDYKNQFYTYEESFSFYSSNIQVPIYTFWSFYLNLGVVGGKIISGFSQGEAAAKLALQVLDGEDIEKIPVIQESPNQFIFDYHYLKKHNISIDILPEDSIIINQPLSIKEFYTQYQLYINIVIAFIIFLITVIIILFFNIQQKNIIQKRLLETNNAYFRFVPKEFLKYLGKDDILNVHLGDATSKEMTVLFSDIRGFTSISEQMSPENNFLFINEYLKFISPAIRMYNGFIDKFIGDAIMALFPDPHMALRASIEMFNRLYDFNEYLSIKNLPQVSIGIGIHHGKVTLGTLGEEYRMDGTVISDVVNVASRLESLTKKYKSKIICSRDVLEKIQEKKNHYLTRYLGKVIVKGKSRSIAIYEIIDAEETIIKEQKIKNKQLLEEILYLYEQNHKEEAKNLILNHKEKFENDGTLEYLSKLLQ